jgi:hypothetical protein
MFRTRPIASQPSAREVDLTRGSWRQFGDAQLRKAKIGEKTCPQPSVACKGLRRASLLHQRRRMSDCND